MKCWGIDMAHLIVRDDAGNVTFDSKTASIIGFTSIISITANQWVLNRTNTPYSGYTVNIYRYTASWLKSGTHFVPVRNMVVYNGYMEYTDINGSSSGVPTGSIPIFEMKGK